MSLFIEQVQLLMHVHQLKYSEDIFGENNFKWLSHRKSPVVWMSTKDEFKIRTVVIKMNEEQRFKVLKQLVTWLEEHPRVSSLKIPEMCLHFLHKMVDFEALNAVTMTRVNSFRSSLRRFSVLKNRVAPTAGLQLPPNRNEPRRSVTFNDELQIFKI